MVAAYNSSNQSSILLRHNSQSSTTKIMPYCQLKGQREPDGELGLEGIMSSFDEREVAALPVEIEE